MRAIVITKHGGPEVLEIQERPSPPCGAEEVRVRVGATAVNRADLLQRRGFYPAPPGVPAEVPGLEFAGEVVEVGASVASLSRGDRVFGLVGGGSYAEELVVDARTVTKMPAGLAFREAAAVPEAFITAYDAMVTQAGLARGDTVLVHAVGSGVGTAAVQIARAIGARVIGTSRSAAKLERARPLGMDHGIVAEGNRFADAVLEATDRKGANVVLELVGGPYVTEDLACTAPRGRIVVVGLVAGARADVDLGAVLRKRLTIIGTVLRARPLEEKIAVNATFASEIVPRLARGELAPVIDRAVPLEHAAEAHAYVEGNEPFGKVVLETGFN
jgi:putative PIG3 family NAD(P)H quinone oxidoreductase